MDLFWNRNKNVLRFLNAVSDKRNWLAIRWRESGKGKRNLKPIDSNTQKSNLLFSLFVILGFILFWGSIGVIYSPARNGHTVWSTIFQSRDSPQIDAYSFDIRYEQHCVTPKRKKCLKMDHFVIQWFDKTTVFFFVVTGYLVLAAGPIELEHPFSFAVNR